MKKFLLLSFLCFAAKVSAQVGISNTDPKAQLDISASNPATPANTDGILIPRVSAFPAANPAAAQNGMMVFLTTAAGNNQPGFYYWDNATTSWIGVGSNTANQWSLNGNAGTSSATHFIGTTDGQEVIFKMNNFRSGRIGLTGTFFGNRAGILNTGGNENTFFGAFAGQATTVGPSNTYVGYVSGGSNTTGEENVFVGKLAGGLSATGSRNVFLGVNAGRLNSGEGSVIIGNFAGANVSSSGNRNTLLGVSTVMNSGLTNATAIGADASVSASNSLVLGSIAGVNSATSSVNVGIGTAAPLDRLHVVGNLRMVDGNQAAGKVLTSDANGTATWQNASANAWGMTGNAGTSPATNFIGTIDNQDVVFKRNNVKSGLLNLNNTAFGVNALTAVTTGNNTAFGFNALQVSTAGLNAAFGSKALQATTTGNQNTALGTEAMSSNTIGSNNVAVGYEAMMFNTVARNNIAIGNLALFNQSFANGNVAFDSDNIAIGFGAMAQNQPTATTNGVNNLAIGTRAMSANTIGTGNVAVGNNALQGNTVSSENTAIGFEALKTLSFSNGNTAYASNNTAIGYQSMMNTQPTTSLEGDANVAVGARTLRANTTGSFNVALGSSALESNTDAVGNTAVGYLSLNENTTGGNNTAVGGFTLANNISGNNNVGLGSNVLAFNERGNGNVAIGFAAMQSNRSSGSNVAIGNLALQGQAFTNGNTSFLGYNVAIGERALQGNSPTASTNGNHNTAVGYFSLIGNTTGIKNTALGSEANVSSGTLNNATAIGANAFVGASNSLVLGSINGINSATSSVNVGIGTTTPLAPLDIVSDNVNTGSLVRGNLNVMSGVAGNTDVGAALTLGGYRDAAATEFRVFGSVEGRKSNASSGSSDGYLQFKTNDSGTLVEQMRIIETGNVGIGTTAPDARLEIVSANVVPSPSQQGIVGILSSTNQAIDVGGSLTLGGRTTNASTVTQSFASVEGRKSSSTSGISSGYMAFKTNNNVGMVERMRITAVGDVGIGTAVPGGQFQLSLDEGRKPGTNTWTVPSDARLKNVSGNYEKGLNEISRLRPIRYHYKDVGEKKFEQKVLNEEFAGFLAQEVRQVFPEAVGTDPDGYLNFNMHSILVASVNAIRELNDKNAQLETVLQSQSEHVERLEKELRQQKQLLQAILEKLPEN